MLNTVISKDSKFSSYAYTVVGSQRCTFGFHPFTFNHSLYRVGEEEHLPARRACHRLHAPVLQESRLEHPFARLAVEVVGLARRAGPYLRYVAVAAFHRRERRFRRHYLPLRVVEQRVCGHVAAHVHAFLPSVLLGVGERLVERAVVKMILELVRQIGVLSRLVLRTPVESVVFLPFALERLAVSAARPELRLLEEYGVYSRVDDGSDLPFLEILEVVLCRHDVGNEVSVPYGVALHGLLSLVQMPLAVPFAGEVVLISAPGDAGHEVRGVAPVAPRLHPLPEGESRTVVRSVHHHHVSPYVGDGFPLA